MSLLWLLPIHGEAERGPWKVVHGAAFVLHLTAFVVTNVAPSPDVTITVTELGEMVTESGMRVTHTGS